jgi:hypothetical protein
VHNLPFQHPPFMKCQSIEYLVISNNNNNSCIGTLEGGEGVKL